MEKEALQTTIRSYQRKSSNIIDHPSTVLWQAPTPDQLIDPSKPNNRRLMVMKVGTQKFGLFHILETHAKHFWEVWDVSASGICEFIEQSVVGHSPTILDSRSLLYHVPARKKHPSIALQVVLGERVTGATAEIITAFPMRDPAFQNHQNTEGLKGLEINDKPETGGSRSNNSGRSKQPNPARGDRDGPQRRSSTKPTGTPDALRSSGRNQQSSHKPEGMAEPWKRTKTESEPKKRKDSASAARSKPSSGSRFDVLSDEQL